MQPMQPGYGAQGPGYGAPPAAPVAGKNVAIALIVIALAIAVGAFTHSWGTATEGHGDFSVDVGAGLTGAKASACEEGECHDGTVDWGGDSRGDDDSKSTNDLKYLGYLAMLGALAAIGVCAVAGGMTLAGNARKVKPPVFMAIALAAAGLMVIFLIRVITKDLGGGGESEHLKIGWSGIVAIGAAVAGGIVIQTGLGPVVRAAQAAPLPMAQAMPYGAPMGMPQQMPPQGQMPMQQPIAASACPRCGGALTYVAQYQRNFCQACQQYA